MLTVKTGNEYEPLLPSCGAGDSLHLDTPANSHLSILNLPQQNCELSSRVFIRVEGGQQKLNGHGSRLSLRKRSRPRDARTAASQSCGRREEEENGARRSLKRRTARAAVNKIKLLEASLSDEDCDEENPRRSSGRLRSSRRTAVIQSSSESEGAPAGGTQSSPVGCTKPTRPRVPNIHLKSTTVFKSVFLPSASWKRKEAGGESEGGGGGGDDGASPQGRQNGEVGADKHGASRRAHAGEEWLWNASGGWWRARL